MNVELFENLIIGKTWLRLKTGRKEIEEAEE